MRSYANISDELEPAGYNAGDIAYIKERLEHYLALREVIRKASGETLDLKAYEADMRHMIDTYIEAAEPRIILRSITFRCSTSSSTAAWPRL